MSFRNKAEGSGITFMLAIAAIGIGIIGWGTPQVLCTPSTVGTATCQLPANGCDGVYRVGIGRCEKGTGLTLTISSGQTGSGNVITTYSTAFTNTPILTITSSNVVTYPGTLPFTISNLAFLTARIFPWTIPVALTEFPGNESRIVFNPSAYSQIQLSVQFSAATIPAAGSLMYVQISGDGGTTWTTLVSFLVDGTAVCTFAGSVNDLTCSDFVNMPALPTLSVDSYLLRIAGSAGDGTTKIQWSQIQASFRIKQAPPVSWQAANGLTPKASFTMALGIPYSVSTGSISEGFSWMAWSPTG